MLNKTNKNSPTFIALLAFLCVGSLDHFYTTHKHSLETDVRTVQPKKTRVNVQVLVRGCWCFSFTTFKKGKNNKEVKIFLLAQSSSVLSFGYSGWQLLALCENLTNSCSNKAKWFLHNFAGKQNNFPELEFLWQKNKKSQRAGVFG